ncbi:MAG: hypothetical protein P3W93_009560 [Thermus sp.]|nr:hypothetical protein [Thermus sp.]
MQKKESRLLEEAEGGKVGLGNFGWRGKVPPFQALPSDDLGKGLGEGGVYQDGPLIPRPDWPEAVEGPHLVHHPGAMAILDYGTYGVL